MAGPGSPEAARPGPECRSRFFGPSGEMTVSGLLRGEQKREPGASKGGGAAGYGPAACGPAAAAGGNGSQTPSPPLMRLPPGH